VLFLFKKMNSTSTRTLRSGVKPVIEYKKRSKKIKLVLEESIAEPEPVFDVPEPETEPLNKSNTSLEIFGPAEDEYKNDSMILVMRTKKTMTTIKN